MKELFDLVKGYHKFHLELSYCSVCDWMLKIYRRGPYDDQEEIVIFEDQCCDYEYLIAKAQVAVKDYLMEKYGGY